MSISYNFSVLKRNVEVVKYQFYSYIISFVNEFHIQFKL